jgi:probable H4MPT-linked C1 transfer pathway protein
VLALDIGGANLKAAHSGGSARTQPFELWKQPAELPGALANLVTTFPKWDRLAVTMTGELCDCFASKREGVLHILKGVEEALETFGPGSGGVSRPAPSAVHVWRTDGTWAALEAARQTPLLCAASNWLALASFAGRFTPTGSAILLDIGSTTTDIVPLVNGKPVPTGRSDPERMRSRELVYTGARRTPVCALLGEEGAAEWFATTLDVYLLLGSIPDDREDLGTADGRPATRACAHARLARMLCSDGESCDAQETLNLARRVQDRQVSIVRAAYAQVVRRLPEPPKTVVLSGSGEFLGRMVVDAGIKLVSLERELGVEASRAACATALAHLAIEQLG